MRDIRMNIFYNLFSKKLLTNRMNINSILNYFDYFLLTIVIVTFLGNFIDLLSSTIYYLIDFYNINGLDLIQNMADNNSSVKSGNNTTTTTIIHDDGNWYNAIRSIFIYGVGGYRLTLLKAGGTPATRAFVIVSTIAGDSLTKVINNTINDPDYVKNHVTSWKSIWENYNDGKVKVDIDDETTKKLMDATNINKNNFISGDSGLGDLPQELLNGIFDRLKLILEPVQVNYSNEILANQINDLSILLFILSLIIFALIVVLLINIILYINMDKIINFFKNKFIHWYLVFNKKFLSIEIFMLGATILYFMHVLINAIRFIATHPILIK